MSDPNKTPEALIYDQIETMAGYNPPGIYNLLTRYDSLKTKDDPEALNYIPLTTVQNDASWYLPFIVGILPPVTTTQKRRLDRSATVQAVTAPNALPEDNGPRDQPPTKAKVAEMQSAKDMPGGAAVAGVYGADRGPPILYKYSPKQIAAAIRDAYRARFRRDPTQAELTLLTKHSYVETGGKWPNNNPGGIGNWNPPEYPKEKPPIHGIIPKGVKTYGVWGDSIQSPTGAGKSAIRYFRSYDSPQAGATAFLNKVANGLDAARGGDIDAYVASLGGKGKYKGSSYYGPPDEILPTQEQKGRNEQITREQAYRRIFGTPEGLAQLAKEIGPVADLDSSSLPRADNVVRSDVTPASMEGKGSDAASDARKNISGRAGRNLPPDEFQRQLLEAQQKQIDATNDQIDRMARIPPLKMLVNPTSFKFSAEKITADGNWGRSGAIIEHWGNQQEKIEGSGKLAAFYALDAQGAVNGDGSAGNSPGINRTARAFSMSYQNFLSLYLLYKNNGGIWFDDYFSNAHSTTKRLNLSLIGAVYIYYDSTLYVGSFDNFTITESDATPFTLEYSFSFTVRSWFLLDRKDWYEKKAPTNSIPTRLGKAERTDQEQQLANEAFNQKAAREAELAQAAAAFAEGAAKFDAQYLAPPPDLPPPAKTIPTHSKNR